MVCAARLVYLGSLSGLAGGCWCLWTARVICSCCWVPWPFVHERFTKIDSTSQDKVEVGSSSPVHSFSADGCFKLIHGVKFGVVSREAVEFKSGEL